MPASRPTKHAKTNPAGRWLTLLLVVLLLVATGLVQWILADDATEASTAVRPTELAEPPHDEVEAELAPAQQRGPVRGVVRGPDGRLLAGAQVTVQHSDDAPTPCQPGRTGADGAFDCGDVAFPARVSASTTTLPAPPARLAARVLAASTTLQLTLRRPASVQGRVLEGFAPVRGAEIRIHDLAPLRIDGKPAPATVIAAAAHTDKAGSFAVQGIWPGALRVEARLPDRTPAITPVLRLHDDEARAGLELRIGPGGVLGGTVRSRGGAPLPGARVAIVGVVGGPEGRAGADGSFRVERVPAGTWRFRAEADGHETEEVEVAMRDHAAPSQLFALRPLRGLGGRVVDAAGNAVPGATVWIDVDARRRTVQAGPDGSFRLQDLPAGTGARALAGHPQHADSAEVELLPGTEPVLRLGEPAWLQGRVVGADGQAVAGAAVWIAAQRPQGPALGSQHQMRTPTDAAGRFRLGPLRPGTFDLRGQKEDAPPGVLRGVEAGGGARRSDLEIRLDGGARLVGRVLGPDGAAVQGARLDLRCGEDAPRLAELGPDGAFVFSALPPGTCSLHVRAPDLLVEVAHATIADQGEQQIDVYLRALGQARTVALGGRGATLAEDDAGMVVREVRPGSAAERAGLQTGDRVVGVDFRRLGEHDFAGVTAGADQPDGTLTLEVEREGGVITVYVDAAQESP